MSDKLSYRLGEAVKATGIGRSTMFKLIATGELPAFKIGRGTFILASALQSYLNQNAAA